MLGADLAVEVVAELALAGLALPALAGGVALHHEAQRAVGDLPGPGVTDLRALLGLHLAVGPLLAESGAAELVAELRLPHAGALGVGGVRRQPSPGLGDSPIGVGRVLQWGRQVLVGRGGERHDARCVLLLPRHVGPRDPVRGPLDDDRSTLASGREPDRADQLGLARGRGAGAGLDVRGRQRGATALGGRRGADLDGAGQEGRDEDGDQAEKQAGAEPGASGHAGTPGELEERGDCGGRRITTGLDLCPANARIRSGGR